MRGGPAGEGRPSRRRPVERAPAPPHPPRAAGARRAGGGLAGGRDGVRGGARPRVRSAPRADFAGAWERGDYRAMYALLDDASRQAYSAARVRARLSRRRGHRHGHRDRGGRPGRRAGRLGRRADRCAHAGLRHACAAELVLPGERRRGVTWGPLLAFPGLRRGEALDAPQRAARARRAAVARRQGAGRGAGGRAQLAARRRSPARSPGRSSPRRPARSAARSTRAASRATGRWARTGSSTPSRTAWPGGPGGELLAGERVLARARPSRAAAGAHHDRHAASRRRP